MRNITTFCFAVFCLAAINLSSQDLGQLGKEKPWDWSGSIGANTNFYHAQGINNRSNPFFWNLTARMTGKIYGFQLPFSFTVGQHNFDFSRPFLQLGASPSYKWVKLHVGTRNLTFSPYTLAGHTFDGGGIELTPGKLRFSAMAGRFRKARNYNPEVDLQVRPIVYKRTGYAVKLGFGTDQNYFDLIYFNAKDAPSSITLLPADTLIKPAENAVVGFSTKIKLARRIGFFADGAVSAFTRNLYSKETKDYIEPDISSIFTPRYSTRLNYAARAGINFEYPGFGLKASYERIMPEFETMGAYFFANDREIFSLSPRFSLFKRQVNVYGKIGLQRNNLLNSRSERTDHLIGMINVSYFSPKGFGVNANYTNLSVEQFEGLSEVIDTFRVALVTTNISLAPTYSWSDSSRTQAIVLAATYQQLNDRNPFTRDFTDMTTSSYNANYNLTFIRTGLGINVGANFTIIEIYNLNTERYGGTIGLSQSLSDYKYNLNLSSTYNLTSINGGSDGSVFSVNFTVAYSPSPKHSLSLFTSLLNNKSTNFNDYTELYGGLSYTFQIR